MTKSFLSLALLLLASALPATAQFTDPVPCTDGVFSGDVGALYTQILAEYQNASALDKPDTFFASLSPEKQKMVLACAGKGGADDERYNFRGDVNISCTTPLTTVCQTVCVETDPITGACLTFSEQCFDQCNGTEGDFVIGQLYDYLDPNTTDICDEYDPLDPSVCVSSHEGQMYYTAVVLSGCYTDNVFGDNTMDQPYLFSVGWTKGGGGGGGSTEANHDFQDLQRSDKVVAEFECGDGAISLSPLVVDLIGKPGAPEGGGALDDPDIQWDEVPITSGGGSPSPTDPDVAGFAAGTSTVWNMLFSEWDVADVDGIGGDERLDGNEWKSPDADFYGDGSTTLCNEPGDCELDYADDWFDDVHNWEWQVVYEMSWDVSACGTPPDLGSFVLDFNELTHASPSKQAFEFCVSRDTLGALTLIKDSAPDNPWAKFRFEVRGPTTGPPSATLQDWGSNECPPPELTLADGSPVPDCSNTAAWTYPDRVTFNSLVASDNRVAGGNYTVVEDEEGANPLWECKNIDPACAEAELAGDGLQWDDACTVVPTSFACDPDGVFATGSFTGEGPATDSFPICQGAHVVCRATNVTECVESVNAIGDLQVVGGLQTDAVSFAASAVASETEEAPTSIFLGSFTPIADESRWPGQIDHYVQPLPVREVTDTNGNPILVPDDTVTCVDEFDDSCFAWDSSVEILSQAPTLAEVDTDRKIGATDLERRVTYTFGDNVDTGTATNGQAYTVVPRLLETFDYEEPFDPQAKEYDIWDGFGLSYVPGVSASESTARGQSQDIIKETLAIRTRTVSLSTGDVDVDYVQGDAFHGEPVLVAGPSNFNALAVDLGGDGTACDDGNPGYACFFQKHRRRRHVLLVPSNDGQVHAFDAGLPQIQVSSGLLTNHFSLGTGKEVFAHIPRPMLSHTADMTVEEHDWGVDGQIVVADVFIDPVQETGVPEPTEREWRTTAMVSYRGGGRGYALLDLTQPDPLTQQTVTNPVSGIDELAFIPDHNDEVTPGCSSLKASMPAGCGTLPYPAVLWEFNDYCVGGIATADGQTVCDEDANGEADLAFSWSAPNIGRIQVMEPSATEPSVRTVAVFGGGLDDDNLHTSGNFLYMVDVETGQAIYKRELEGAAPSEPAAVDVNFDGLLDTVYIGTTLGYMYKVDLSTPPDIDATTGRIEDTTQWSPFQIFSTEDSDGIGRPIFFPPQVIFVSQLGQYALAFGTGDRSDLWSTNYQTASGGQQFGRYYLIVDPGFVEGQAPIASGPLTEDSYSQIALTDAATTQDFVLAPLDGNQAGWVLLLDENERLVTDTLAVSGLVAFTTFDSYQALTCQLDGDGAIFAVAAPNANPLGENRYRTVEGEFAGTPIVTSEGMRRTDVTPGDPDPDADPEDPFDADEIQQIRQSLADLFPAGCRFGNFSVNVSAALSNRGQLPIAQIPVCVAPKNWKELF